VLGVEQGRRRGQRGVGVPAGAHDRLHDRAVEDDDQLIGQPLRVVGVSAPGLAGEVLAQP
jgi:hypothetical protein